MRFALVIGSIVASGCSAEVAGTPSTPEPDDPIERVDPEPEEVGEDPDAPLGDGPEVTPPDGPAGVCWGALRFDSECSRGRASGQWEVAFFPGPAARAAVVSTDAMAEGVLVAWGPAGEDQSVGWSDTLVERDGRIGALRLLVAGTGSTVTATHANGASTKLAWRDGWQDEPTGVVQPGFDGAFHELGAKGLGWSAEAVEGGLDIVHTVEAGTIVEEHHVLVDARGETQYRYRRLEGPTEVEAFTSDDGRSWRREGEGEDVALAGTGEMLLWGIDLPAAIPVAEGQYLEGRSSRLGAELGWLEGDFVGLGAALIGGYGIVSDLWIDPTTASIRSVAVMYWDGTELVEWDASNGGLDDGDFPATYQDDHGSRVVISDGTTDFAAVEAVVEDAQLRVVAADLLGVGAIAAAYRWEVVFETESGLATGEVVVERTDARGCQRHVSYDFGTSWSDGGC